MPIRTISAPLRTHLDGSATSLATLWTITRRDGRVLRFTDHDGDIVIGGVTYKSAVGYERTAIEGSADLSVGGMDAIGILDSARIDEADLRGGLFDYADVEIVLVDWSNPSGGTAILQSGKMGEIIYSEREGRFSTELRDISQAYSQTIVESFTVNCRADLGDDRCTLPVLPDVIAHDTAYAIGDVVRVRKPVEDIVVIHAPGVTDEDDDSQYAAVGTVGSTAAAADTNKLKHLAGNFRFTPSGGPTENPSNSFVSWVDAAQYQIGYEPFTIEMWVNFDAVFTGGVGPVLASQYSSTSSQRSWFIMVGEETSFAPGLSFVLYPDGGSTRYIASVSLLDFTPRPGDWYHIAVARDVNHRLRIFVDGEVKAAAAFEHSPFDTTAPLRLGTFDSTPGGNRHFEGSIEDFRIVVGAAIYTDDFTVPASGLASTVDDPLDLTEDYNDTNYRCTVAGTTHASLPFVFPNTVDVAETGATTLSAAATSTFTRPTGSFVTDGFISGMVIRTTSFANSENNGDFRISTVSATSLVVAETTLVTESGGGGETMTQIPASFTAEFSADLPLRVGAQVLYVTNRREFSAKPPTGGGLLRGPIAFANSGAETGDLTGWDVTTGSVVVVTSPVHSGSYAFKMSPEPPTNDDSEMQTSIDLSDWAVEIDVGSHIATLSWYMYDLDGFPYDESEIIMSIDWLNVAGGTISTFTGSRKTAGTGQWLLKTETATIPSLTRTMRVRPYCDRAARGNVGMDDFSVTTTLTEANFPDGDFNYGVVTWETGLNAGLSMEVKGYTQLTKTFILYESMPFAITPGDKFGVSRGCNRESSRCKDFENIENYRGFLFIPGDDAVNRVPSSA